jgi:putative flavoprotein involved in K+ transport
VFAPKDQIGDWLEMYTKVMEREYRGSTECTRAAYDEARGEWTVELVREGRPMTLRPKQLVLATGMSAVPDVPTFPGSETFCGEQMHSSRFGSGEQYAGQRAVVIGSNNSELAVRSGVDTDTADLIFASLPYRALPALQVPVYEEMKRRDADFYARLEKADFMLDFGDDGSGLFMKYLRRGSGYYIDVGASELVANGDVKLKSGVQVERIGPTSVTFSDGSELPADVIVYATGYGSMNGWAARLISQEVADKVGKCWGLGFGTRKDPGPWEGELRNMWTPTHQPGLWFHGGNLHQSRHYSQFLSLQLKARMEGIPTPVYGMQPVHHLS